MTRPWCGTTAQLSVAVAFLTGACSPSSGSNPPADTGGASAVIAAGSPTIPSTRGGAIGSVRGTEAPAGGSGATGTTSVGCGGTDARGGQGGAPPIQGGTATGGSLVIGGTSNVTSGGTPAQGGTHTNTGGTTVGGSAGGSPVDPTMSAGTAGSDGGAVTHPRQVVLCDEGNKRVVRLDLSRANTAVWSKGFAAESPRDLQLVGGGRLAISSLQGYLELDIDNGAVKKQVNGFTGVESIRRLSNGNTILAGNSDGGVTVQELDAQDKLVPGRKVTFANYGNLRILRRTRQDSFLIGVGSKLAEVNWNKQILWEMEIPIASYVFQGLRTLDGGIVATTGYGASLVVIDPATKKVVRTIGGKEQPDATNVQPNFYAGFQILANGHFVVTNWEGHGGGNGGIGIQLLEYDSSGQLVWKWKQDPKLVSSLHNLLVLDGLDTSRLNDDVDGTLGPVSN